MADVAQNERVNINKPLPAPIEKRAGLVRWQLMLTSNNRKALHQLWRQHVVAIENLASARKVLGAGHRSA